MSPCLWQNSAQSHCVRTWSNDESHLFWMVILHISKRSFMIFWFEPLMQPDAAFAVIITSLVPVGKRKVTAVTAVLWQHQWGLSLSGGPAHRDIRGHWRKLNLLSAGSYSKDKASTPRISFYGFLFCFLTDQFGSDAAESCRHRLI